MRTLLAQYESPDLQAAARAAMPTTMLQASATEAAALSAQLGEQPPRAVEDALAVALLGWFKAEFFSWVRPAGHLRAVASRLPPAAPRRDPPPPHTPQPPPQFPSRPVYLASPQVDAPPCDFCGSQTVALNTVGQAQVSRAASSLSGIAPRSAASRLLSGASRGNIKDADAAPWRRSGPRRRPMARRAWSCTAA